MRILEKKGLKCVKCGYVHSMFAFGLAMECYNCGVSKFHGNMVEVDEVPTEDRETNVSEKNILKEALHTVDGDRGKFYGHPLDNHSNTASFWSDYIKRKYDVDVKLDARDVCMMMVLLKVSRDANRPKEDNLVDIAGYVRNAQMIEEEQKRRRPPSSE